MNSVTFGPEMLKAMAQVKSLKLSNDDPTQNLDGWPLRNSRCNEQNDARVPTKAKFNKF